MLGFRDALERVVRRQVAAVGRVYSGEDRMEGALVFAEKRDLALAGSCGCLRSSAESSIFGVAPQSRH